MSQFAVSDGQPGNWEELISFCVGLKLRGFKRMADRSRMNREVHVRFCGGLEVKFLRSTRLTLGKKSSIPYYRYETLISTF